MLVVRTYSHAVIVRAHIHSERSNMFTIESYPPEARYLQRVSYMAERDQKEGESPSPRIQGDRYTAADVGGRTLADGERGVVHDAKRMFLVVRENDAVAGVVEHGR